MAKGVKKIGYKKGKTKSITGNRIVTYGKEGLELHITEWDNDTTDEDKKKGTHWILQSYPERKIISSLHIPFDKDYKLTIPNNLCGIYEYYVEASLTGKRDKRTTGLIIQGNCISKITKVKWCKSANGEELKQAVGKGTHVFLFLETEGLNAFRSLKIEVYAKTTNTIVTQVETQKVIDGKTSVLVNTTFFAPSFTPQESYYIKVKNPVTNQYISDGQKIALAEYLQVNTLQLNITPPQSPTNLTVLKIGQNKTNTVSNIPCKYEAIEIIDNKGTRLIFDEKLKKLVKKQVPIIAPDFENHKIKVSLKLKNVKTNKCINAGKKNSHINNTIEIIETPTNFINVKKSNDALTFETGFEYHTKKDSLLGKSSYGILAFIFPTSLPKNNENSFKIKTQTCGYNHLLDIIVYPDVKWTFSLKFGMKGPEQVTHTNLPTYDRRNQGKIENDPKKVNSRFSSKQEEALKAGKKNYRGYIKKSDGMELEFQLSLKAEYNKGEEFELAEKYAEKIKKFLNILILLKDGLDRLTKIDKVNSGHKSAVRGIGNINIKGKILKSPIIGTIDYPAINIGGKWEAAIDEKSNDIYTSGKLVFGFNPLLKGDVSLDIIAAVSYVPAFGQAVRAIEIALNTVGAELNFLLTIFGQVNVEGEYAFAEKGGSNLNISGELGIKITLSGKVKLKFDAVIFTVDGEISAEGYAVTSIKPKLSVGHDNVGTFLEAKCDFMGVNIVCIVAAKGKNNSIQYKDTYNLLEREDDFVKSKAYVL